MNFTLLSFVFLLFAQLVFSQTNLCTPNPCRYGECEQLQDTFACHCVDGVKGDKCNRLLLPSDNRCSINPCWNNGLCKDVNFGPGWLCVCLPGTAGLTCRTKLDLSCKDKCKNGGECLIINFVAKCSCKNDYTGQACETKVPLCDRVQPQCVNGGLCVNNTCKCPLGFQGETCETQIPRTLSILNKGAYTALVTFSYVSNNNTRKVDEATLTSGLTKVFTYDRNATQQVLRVSALAGKKDFVYERVLNYKECWHVWGTTLNPFYSKIDC